VVQCIDKQAQDGNAYMEKRAFLEAQGWWGQKTGSNPIPTRGAAEHLHVAMCFPLHQDVKGKLAFSVRVMGHNLPSGSVIQNTLLHDPDGGTFATLHWNATVISSDTTMWKTDSVDTRLFDNGWREFRILTQVARPNGAEIHTSSGWCWHVVNTNGKPFVDSGTCVSSRFNTMGRGWYDCYEYKIAETKNWQYPWAGIPHNVNDTLFIGARDGAGDNNLVSRYEVRLDPSFHQGILGDSIAAGNVAVTNQRIVIKGQFLDAGIHRLVIITTAGPSCTTATGVGIVPQNGEVSAVMSIPIKVN
jgi:hypothetical protein